MLDELAARLDLDELVADLALLGALDDELKLVFKEDELRAALPATIGDVDDVLLEVFVNVGATDDELLLGGAVKPGLRTVAAAAL